MDAIQASRKVQQVDERKHGLRGWKSHPLLAYFLLAYALSWLIWVPLALRSQGLLTFSLPPSLAFWLTILPNTGPLFAALFLVAILQGAEGMRIFFRQFLIWRIDFRWYLFALFEPTLVALIVMVFASLFGGPSFTLASPPAAHTLPLPSGVNPWVLIVPIFLITSIVGGPVGEEPGWRGYALPRLQGRYSALGASLLLGVLWTLWHLPLFFIKGSSQSTMSFPLFAFGTIVSAILITWVYNNTRGSVLLTLLFHEALNMSGFYFPITIFNDWRVVILHGLVALVIVIMAGPAHLSRQSPSQRVPSLIEPGSSK